MKIKNILLASLMFLTGCSDNTPASSELTIPKDDLLFYANFDDDDEYIRDASKNFAGEFKIENVFNQGLYRPSSPALRRNGVVGKSLSFDGWSNYIDTYSNEGMMTNGSLSVNVWIAPRVWELPTDILCPIVEYYDSARDAGFIFGYGKYGTWGLRMKFKNTGWMYVSNPSNKLDLYEWTNIGFTYDRDAKKVILYRNGLPIYSSQTSTDREVAFSTLKIGQNTYQQTAVGLFRHNMFSGLMDELCIYQKALAPQEVTLLFERGLDENKKIKPCGYENVQYPIDYLKEDIYRPEFHSAANVHWSSDASGGFYYNGMYHQFYQSDDTGPIWRTFTWGHLVSEDMVHWYSVEPAIYAEDNRVDSYSTFAGSAIVANNVPYIIYTGIANNDPETAKLSLATPVDLKDKELKKWKKLDVVIPLPKEIKIRGEFRDPFTYKEDGYVYIIATASLSNTGSHLDGDPSMIVFRSREDDMRNWEYKGVFFTLSFKEQRKIGFMWELPQLYKITSPSGKTKYLFTCTPVKSGDIINDMLYWIGDFDKANCRFIPDKKEAELLDKGSNVLCAGSGFFDPVNQKNVSTSVIQCVGQRSEYDRVMSGWVGCYQLYRNYGLNDDGTLSVQFNNAYTSLHDKLLLQVKSPTKVNDVSLNNVRGRKLHIRLSLNMNNENKAGLTVFANQYGSSGVSLYYEQDNERFVLNTLYSKSEVLGHNYVYFTDKKIDLDIYIDKSVVEFTVNQRYAFSARCFVNKEYDLLSFIGSNWTIDNLEIYSMKSIC